MSRSPRKHRSRLLRAPLLGVACVLVVGSWGCSDLAASSPLDGARRSPEALARAALQALEAADDSALASLLVTRSEYETLIWPRLPDAEHMPFEFVWSLNYANSRKARRILLEDWGGKRLELVGVELGEEVERYDGLTLYPNARMTVRRSSDGEEGLFPLMDTLVEMEGGWKLVNVRENT